MKSSFENLPLREEEMAARQAKWSAHTPTLSEQMGKEPKPKSEPIWFLNPSLRTIRTAAMLLFLILFLTGGALLFYNVPHLQGYVQMNGAWWLMILLFIVFFGLVALVLTLMNMAAKKRLKAAGQ